MATKPVVPSLSAELCNFSDSELEREVERRQQLAKEKPFLVDSPVDTWKVTTEGDCEGRSTCDLGIHTGHIADIALKLGGFAMYQLSFEPVRPDRKVGKSPVTEVFICVDGIVNGGVTDRSAPIKYAALMESFLGAGYTVKPGQYYHSVRVSKK